MMHNFIIVIFAIGIVLNFLFRSCISKLLGGSDLVLLGESKYLLGINGIVIIVRS